VKGKLSHLCKMARLHSLSHPPSLLTSKNLWWIYYLHLQVLKESKFTAFIWPSTLCASYLLWSPKQPSEVAMETVRHESRHRSRRHWSSPSPQTPSSVATRFPAASRSARTASLARAGDSERRTARLSNSQFSSHYPTPKLLLHKFQVHGQSAAAH
jgi:hypothetical protein